MSYHDHEVVAVRKTNYDMLWHVCYRVPAGLSSKTTYRETYDRVERREALRVAATIGTGKPRKTKQA